MYQSLKQHCLFKATPSTNESTNKPVFGSAPTTGLFGSNTPNTSIQFGTNSNTTSANSKITFGTTNLFQPFTNTNTPTKPDSSTATTTTTTLGTMESVFGSKSGMSFADLAKTASPMGFGGGFISQSNPFSSIVKGQAPPPMLFGQKTKTGGGDEDGEEGGEGNPEDYEPEVFYY